MKTKYKHIHFEKSPTCCVPFWECLDNKDNNILGHIKYHIHRKCFVFEIGQADRFTTLSSNQIGDILYFLKRLDRRGGEKNE